MSDLFLPLKLVHILGAAVLFGTGAGIAFFMLTAHRTRDAATIAATARIVVIADAVFTAGAVIVQPLSGAALAGIMGISLWEPWIVLSLALYVLVGVCWLPVVWIQVQAARSRGRRCRAKDRTPETLRYLVSHLVLAGLAGLLRRPGDFRVDALETGVVVKSDELFTAANWPERP